MDKKTSQSLISRYCNFEVMTYLLLFLFPIAGMLVRGWLTNIFNLLFLVSLFYLHKRDKPLHKEDKVYLGICAAYVGIYVLSSIVNGWGDIQTHDLGTEIRFLLIIPIYLMIREQPESWRWLLYGSLLGIVVIFIQACHEVYWQGKGMAWGVYSKNIIGPFAALMGFWILFLWQEQPYRLYRSLIIIVFVLAVLATALSGSRGAYVGLMFLVCGGLLIFIRTRWVFAAAVLAFFLLGLVYQNTPIVKQGINQAIDGARVYLSNPDIARSKKSLGSTELHMEMWRATQYFFSDHPIIGVGPGNYASAAKKYAQEQLYLI